MCYDVWCFRCMMSSGRGVRRDGSEVSEKWRRTFTNATFRLVDVEREDPVHSRTRGGCQVCLVRWMNSWIEEPLKFYKKLKAAMPVDTRIFGCKDDDCYFAILAFPCSFASWVGLKGHFSLRYDDGKKEDLSMAELYVLEEGNSVDEWIEWMHLFCKAPSPFKAGLHSVFGEEFVEEDLKVNKDGVLSNAGDMWMKN